MAITLVTGFPRNGKSYEVVRMMAEEYPDRKKYAANFQDLDYKMLDVEPLEVEDWQQCESGSILFIDEVWEFFEAAGPHTKRAEHIKQLAKHGHKGLDIVMVTQGWPQIDIFVRQLVEWHQHVIRPFGMNYYNVRHFRGIDKNPEEADARKRAYKVSRKNKYKEKIWRYYTSSDAHTVKRQIPFKLIGAIIVLIAFAYYLVKMILMIVNWGEEEQEPAVTSQPQINQLSPDSGDRQAQNIASMFSISDKLLAATGQNKDQFLLGTPEYDLELQRLLSEYYIREKELVMGAPWTSSKWLEVQEPATYPKPYCALMEAVKKCVCNSQQGTRMAVSYEICSMLARNGYFDPTIPDDEIRKSLQPYDPMMDPYSGLSNIQSYINRE